MKGWSPLERLHQIPDKKCPGNRSDYFWDHVRKEWIFVNDDADMRWWLDGLLGYDTGPGEEPKGWPWGEEKYTGKEWKTERMNLNGKPSIIL